MERVETVGARSEGGGGVSVGEKVLAVVAGGGMSLVLSGYEVGKSNHTVYLLDGIRRADSELLARDWFTNQTLQYHGLFSKLTGWALDAGMFEPAFLVGYLLTVLWFAVSGYRVVRAIGGGTGAYLMAVMLSHVSAGGTGLGGFQFLQDGSFLPSNISNVAMLAGIAGLMERRVWAAAVCLGVAGLFHINHALFAPWVLLVGVLVQPDVRERWKSWIAPMVLTGVLVSVNLVPAMLHLRSAGSGAGERMELSEFVELYCRLRHPHHYYPLSWHPLVILASIWTLIPAAVVLALKGGEISPVARRVMLGVAGFLIVATGVAWVFAGVWFVWERLIQMAVFRFSILYIYLACAVTGWGVVDSGLLPAWARKGVVGLLPVGLLVAMGAALSGGAGEFVEEFVRTRWLPLGMTVLLAGLTWGVIVRPGLASGVKGWLMAGLVAGLVGWQWPRWGLSYIPEDPSEYVVLANWARENTAKDALFLVPPQEQSWRVEAHRAVVVNFKGIPQTSGELPEWKRRMVDVTGVSDLTTLSGSFSTTLKAIARTYQERTPSELEAVARKYGCRYVVTMGEVVGMEGWRRVGPSDGTGTFRMYDLGEPSAR